MSINTNLHEKVYQGQGEYLVFHKGEDGVKHSPDKEKFEKIFPIITRLNRPENADRFKCIQQQVQQIDPSLDVMFVPRTYYELCFLLSAIKEDASRGYKCPIADSHQDPYAEHLPDGCWHIARFQDQEDNDDASSVRKLAHMMNGKLLKKVNKHFQGCTSLTFENFHKLTKDKLDGLSRYKGKFGWQHDNSVLDLTRADITDQDRKIVHNAMQLDCSAIAQKAHIIYRGTGDKNDLPFDPTNAEIPYSYSYGSGLFAGGMFDHTAMAFKYMRNDKYGLAQAIDPTDQNAPYFLPKKHTISQLVANNGVSFHPRTLIWDPTQNCSWGFDASSHNRAVFEEFITEGSKEKVTDRVMKYLRENTVYIHSADGDEMRTPPAFQPTIEAIYRPLAGQSLYICGDHNGWHPEPMVQVDKERWVYRLNQNPRQFSYKLKANDKWQTGENHQFDGRNSVVETPAFESIETNMQAVEKRTRITVRHNPGHGNGITIRGSGEGLSWHHGQVLQKQADDVWVWEGPAAPKEFKVLINGREERGPVHKTERGEKVELYPHF